MVQPCGINQQFALESTNKYVLEDILTHNITWAMTILVASVNKRCNIDQYPPTIYRWCLSRTLHYIFYLHNNYPNTRILISKYKFINAYWWTVDTASAVVQTIFIYGDMVFLWLQLSFGSCFNVTSWCCFSKVVVDLSNKIA